MESAGALINLYPDEFDEANQTDHVDDLLNRFANRALGDTLYRVGRDIQRKLSREDRVVGALVCGLENGIEPTVTALCAAAGMRFRATDERGRMYERDREFAKCIWPRGLQAILDETCELEKAGPEATARTMIDRADARLHTELMSAGGGLGSMLG